MRTKAEIQGELDDLKETQELMLKASPTWSEAIENNQLVIAWLEWVLEVEN